MVMSWKRVVALGIFVTFWGCGDDTPSGDDVGIDAGDELVEIVSEPDCDPLDPAACALPWPSNQYLQEDADRETGFALSFGPASLPAPAGGAPLDATLFGHLDGYGLGVPIMAQFPGLDMAPLASEFALEDSLEEDSPTLLYRVVGDALEPIIHWNELDATATINAQRVLFTRPGVLLEPNARYIVAYRNLTTTEGQPIEASPAFAALRDGVETSNEALEGRRDHFEEVFGLLESEGVSRDELTLAWDFHTASEASLHARLDATIALMFEETGADGPALDFDEEDVSVRVPVEVEPGDEVDANIRLSIAGSMTSPSVLREGARGNNELNINEAGELELNGERTINIVIQVPHVAQEQSVGVIVYGHGLLGGPDEIRADHLERIAQELGYVLVAAPLTGMSQNDIDDVLELSSDMSRFPTISDGLHQGIGDYHLLTRAARERLEGALAPYMPEIEIDPERIYYFGASQGGIFGPTYLATSPDVSRGVLAVPGNNYSTMLSRSTNFAQYFSILAAAYRNQIDRQIIIASVQLLWDQTDSVSYYHRMFARTEPSIEALLTVSKGDKQVPVVTNENLARTFPNELAVMENYDQEREIPLVTEAAYPHEGSAMILFDFGNAWPEGRANRPPEDELPDPHPRQAELDELAPLIDTFFESGEVIDVCGGDGCTPL